MIMIPLVLVLAGTLQDPKPLPPQEPAKSAPVVLLEAPSKAQERVPTDPAREVVTSRGERRPRVDLKKPYIRVWFWPPSPPQAGPVGVEGNGSTLEGHSLPEDIRFATSSSRVLDEQAAQGRLAAWLKENRNRRIILDGFADARGGKKINQHLAQSRAEAVKQNLMNLGASGDQISVQGHGSNQPIKGQTQQETWWLSRRVTVTIQEPAAATVKEDHGNPQ